jgi:hypothetical protein
MKVYHISGVPRNFFGLGGGVQKIQSRTEGRENGDLGAVTPWSGVQLNLQMSETRILIRLLRIYFPHITEFRGGFNPPPPPLGTPLVGIRTSTTIPTISLALIQAACN